MILVEEKFGEQNFRVLSLMRILAQIKVVILDFGRGTHIGCKGVLGTPPNWATSKPTHTPHPPWDFSVEFLKAFQNH